MRERFSNFTPPRTLKDRWSDRITAINYSTRAIGLISGTILGAAYFFGGLSHLNAAPTTPVFLQGRIKDSFGTTGTAALDMTIFGNSLSKHKALYGPFAFLSQSLVETAEVLTGGQDPDYLQTIIGYAAGGLLWVGIDRAAKLLYDSGLTKPIYRAIGIRDRRSSPYSTGF